MEEKPKVRKLVLDVLKPHNPSLIEFATVINSIKEVKIVNVIVRETDRETETIKLTLQGFDLNIDEIRQAVENLGAAIHSIDEVTTEID
ncbi:MAG: DUF211 domain-containing protein [Candidatus Woesearchaeota archaeon]